MGLNELYDNARSQIVMIVLLPTVNQAYAMIINVESQRKNIMGREVSETIALISNRSHNHGYSSASSSQEGGYHWLRWIYQWWWWIQQSQSQRFQV